MDNPRRDPILRVFDEIFACEQLQKDAVRAEIKNRGTYWAGGEIWRLRRDVALLRKRLTQAEAAKQ